MVHDVLFLLACSCMREMYVLFDQTCFAVMLTLVCGSRVGGFQIACSACWNEKSNENGQWYNPWVMVLKQEHTLFPG